MQKTFSCGVLMLMMASLAAIAPSEARKEPRTSYPLDTVEGLQAINTKVEAVTYRGRKAVHMIDLPGQAKETVANGNTIALLTDTDFKDGTIDVDVAGAPRSGAVEAARGFVGIAFRVQADPGKFECFYLRPTNARADDQLRRNHSTQYVSEPEYPWYRLRKENPGVYESYVDLEPGAWTHMKIVVAGTQAQLYVNGSDQPALIVNDLKKGVSQGKIALMIGLDTDAYFTNLRLH